MPDFVSEILTAISAAGISYFIARRKNNAEAGMAELALTEKMITMWREQTENLRAEMKRMEAEIQELRAEIEQLRMENTELRSRIE